jgi:D-serine dehydratase
MSPEKGLPFGAAVIPPGGWNVRRDDLHFPLMVLKESALAHNIAAMQQWCDARGYLLAPHGKTTMCPELFQRQLAAGAWGMTVAHASQFLVAVQHGVRRIIIANQLTGRANIHSVAAALAADPNLECWCLVDSVDGVEHLAANLAATNPVRPLGVLLEWGRAGWRTGVRSLQQGLDVFHAIGRHPRELRFAGVEAFEGLGHDSGTVHEFLAGLADLAGRVPGTDLIFSIGGSAYLDEVHLALQRVPATWKKVVRSGCYVTHDHEHYQELQQAAQQRALAEIPEFRPALELWSYVQSVPDPGRALLTFGKRDCPFDLGLPIPLNVQGTITQLNDQHAYLEFPEAAPVRVGDRVACGISHPCTAFDKWRVIPVVDDEYNVLALYHTCF